MAKPSEPGTQPIDPETVDPVPSTSQEPAAVEAGSRGDPADSRDALPLIKYLASLNATVVSGLMGYIAANDAASIVSQPRLQGPAPIDPMVWQKQVRTHQCTLQDAAGEIAKTCTSLMALPAHKKLFTIASYKALLWAGLLELEPLMNVVDSYPAFVNDFKLPGGDELRRLQGSLDALTVFRDGHAEGLGDGWLRVYEDAKQLVEQQVGQAEPDSQMTDVSDRETLA
ncbi:uncharacterized protein LTR77_006063 [Saxophila tyrrhenica]|uniref:Uncharacterized protein n=1 Tax=Saxophila tyrrhenica TaxID=1690608 RepID=A0AAV9P9W5_9PEZI|nr:hypothetical protein LTR77_006063 [Saxophila tyrrhenica]